jgi:hypothetical protein
VAYRNEFEEAKSNILILNKKMTASEMQQAKEEAANLRKNIKKW